MKKIDEKKKKRVCHKYMITLFLGEVQGCKNNKSKKEYKKMLENLEIYPKNYTFVS